MKNIALIAESPNDADSIKNLLLQKYPGMRFTHIAKNRKGGQQDSNKLIKEVKAESMVGGFNHYIFIRDLDDLETNRVKIRAKRKWFEELDRVTGKRGMFLLNIYELEALILSDMAGFNRIFGVKLKFAKDPMRMRDPKEFLINKTKKSRRQYKETDCPEIFKQLDIQTIAKNCGYFKEFLATFDAKLKKAA